MSSTTENNSIKDIAAYVIKLVAAAVNSSSAPEKPEELSWADIFAFAEKQNVLNLVSYACETLDSKPPKKEMQYLREFRKQKMVVEAEQQVETEYVMDRLEKAGIRHMPLKGFVVKNLYPSPDMRTMSDVDMLLEADRIDDAVEMFANRGFSFHNDGDLHANLCHGNTNFEFHRMLVNDSYKNLTAYYGDGFSRAVKCEGYNCRYEMSREDMYIFLLAHLAKHYRYGGTGIRTVLDLYVYRKAYADLDMDYIYAETEKIGLNKFQRHAEEIADEWFSGGFDGTFNDISAYIISGGVYGKRGMFLVNEVINESEGKSLAFGKFRKIFLMIFPGYKLMCELYPVLKKYKFLMPVFWIVRWVKSLTSKNSNLKNTIHASSDILNTSDEMIAAQRAAELGEL